MFKEKKNTGFVSSTRGLEIGFKNDSMCEEGYSVP